MQKYDYTSNIITQMGGPGENFYMDVNHAFGSVLCQITHGPKTAQLSVSPPAPMDAMEAALSSILGRPLHPETETKTLNLVSETESRNGPVLKFDMPRMFHYTDPTSRVLQSRTRRANPFFHLYEAMWFLAGRHDVESVALFAKQIAQYSDDGDTFNGAYGYRWRSHFGGDQIKTIIRTLKENPKDRRCVLQMWDCVEDLQGFTQDGIHGEPITTEYSKDVPCNTHCYVQVRNGELDLTVMNRSNDIFWGMLGSNYVTFSFLLEYLAGMIGIPVGMYHHFTANAHYYTGVFPDEKIEKMHDEKDYGIWVPPARRVPLVSTPENFDSELTVFVDYPFAHHSYTERFFREIAQPMMYAHRLYTNGEIQESIEYLKESPIQEDWKVACIDWIVSSKVARRATSHLNN